MQLDVFKQMHLQICMDQEMVEKRTVFVGDVKKRPSTADAWQEGAIMSYRFVVTFETTELNMSSV